jgi:hypothetical protein
VLFEIRIERGVGQTDILLIGGLHDKIVNLFCFFKELQTFLELFVLAEQKAYRIVN